MAISGIGWCASQHITAFQCNPHTRITCLHGRSGTRTQANLAKYGASVEGARMTENYDDVLAAPHVLRQEVPHAARRLGACHIS